MPKLSELDPSKVKVISEPSKAPETAPTLKLSEIDQSKVKVIEQPKAEGDTFDDVSRSILKGVVTVGRGYEKFLTAPTRSAVKAGLGAQNPAAAFGKQWGEEPELAPTGREIANKQIGLSDEAYIRTPFRKIGGGEMKLAPAQVAGTVIDVLADPTIIFMPASQGIKLGIKGAAKGAAEGTKLLGKAAATAGKFVGGTELVEGATRKMASALGNIPKEKVVEYLSRPLDRVNKARATDDIGRQVYDDVKRLKTEISEGSAKSFDILGAAEGGLDAQDLSEIMWTAQEELKGLMVGKGESAVGSQAKRGISEVQQVIADIQAASGSASGDPGSLSFTDAKKILQNLDAATKRAAQTADFDSQASRVLQTVRKSIDERVKVKVPEYAKQMEKVAADTRLFAEVADGFGDLNTVSGRLKAAATEHRTKLADQESLDALGKRMGTDYLTEAQDRLILEAFFKDAGRGSRYQNIGGTAGAAIGGFIGGTEGAVIGASLGTAAGTVLEKSSGAIAKRMLDLSKGFTPLDAAPKPSTRSIGEAVKDIRSYTSGPRTGMESALKGTQIFSTQDKLSGANERKEAIRRRMNNQ